MKISISLPSLFPESLDRTLKNLIATTKQAKLEIIVASPFRVHAEHFREDGHTVVWIKDDKQDGCNSAHNLASLHATGDFMFAWADDHLFVDGWDVLAFENFFRRETVLQESEPEYLLPFVLGLRQIQSGPDVGGRIGTIFGKYYPYFPLARMSDVRAVGGWFSAEYKHGWGDPDFALRVYTAAGTCEWADVPTIQVNVEEDQARHGPKTVQSNDVNRFLAKWGPTYGKGWPTDLRGFNRDLLVSRFPEGTKTCSLDAVSMPGHGQ